jgi:hypothetical protein
MQGFWLRVSNDYGYDCELGDPCSLSWRYVPLSADIASQTL